MTDSKLIDENDMCLVIPLEGQPYIIEKKRIAEYLHVSVKQIDNAINTGHALKQHYFDEV